MNKKSKIIFQSDYIGLRTLGPFNVFTLLNGWICLHGVLD